MTYGCPSMASGKIGQTVQKLELVEGNTHTEHGDVGNLIFLSFYTNRIKCALAVDTSKTLMPALSDILPQHMGYWAR
jgi:hypothetical protein